MDELKKDVINYLITVDRAVTIDELVDELESSSDDYDQIKYILEDLLEQDYVTADLFGDEVKVSRYYPKDELFNHPQAGK